MLFSFLYRFFYRLFLFTFFFFNLTSNFFFFQLAIEKLDKELVVLDEKKRAVEAVQKLKHKQIELVLQSLADIEATVEEVRSQPRRYGSKNQYRS